MKNKLLKFAEWAENNWLIIIILMITLMLFFVCAIMFSWLYGYWSNALHGTKFELNSCWQGITAVVAGLGGVAALAKTAWTKYNIDSQYNSEQSKSPYQNIVKNEVMNGERH